MDYKTAKIAKATSVDVAITVRDAVGCIGSISTRRGVRGAVVVTGNPLTQEDNGWYPLSQLELCGDTARKVVARYL